MAAGEIEEAEVTPVRRRQDAGIVVQTMHQREPSAGTEAEPIGKAEVEQPTTASNIHKPMATPVGPARLSTSPSVTRPLTPSSELGVTLVAVPAAQGARQHRRCVDGSLEAAPLPGQKAECVVSPADVRDGRDARR